MHAQNYVMHAVCIILVKASDVQHWLHYSSGKSAKSPITLQWRHNEHDGASNHQPHDCLLSRLFRRRSNKTSKLRLTGICAGNSPVTGEFPAQRTSIAENISPRWRHHEIAESSLVYHCLCCIYISVFYIDTAHASQIPWNVYTTQLNKDHLANCYKLVRVMWCVKWRNVILFKFVKMCNRNVSQPFILFMHFRIINDALYTHPGYLSYESKPRQKQGLWY